jgi:tape measure domain-containing protein
MATIRTAIELQDNFTGILYQVINSVNLGLSAMEDLHQTMNAPVDTASIEAARDSINQATIAVQELDAAMQGLENPSTDSPTAPQSSAPVQLPVEPVVPDPLVDPQAPVEVPVVWQSDNLEVFTGTGVERFQQEVQSANNMLNTLNDTQNQIAATAAQTDLFPANMVADMNGMQTRLQAIQQRIQAIENNPLNMGTDTANAELEQLRGQLDQAVREQQNLNRAVEQMDVQGANEAYLRLSSTVSNTERYIRDNTTEQGNFNQAIAEGTQEANGLMDMIKGAVAAYATVQTVTSALNLSDELTQTTARLNMMNDGVQSTDELVNMVYASAENARGSFQEMADVVARFGNNAGDAFGSTAEVVAFAELVQKQMTIAGASTSEAANAMLQLSQGLGSGVLRGDELNSIFEQAPNLIRNIADYLGVSIGEIREMASEGELTADVVKAAIFAATDEINANFEAMPMTWGQIWQSMQNTAIMAFQPVLQRLNAMANSEVFQGFVDQAINAMATVAEIVLNIFDLVAAVGGFIAENWSIIEPIIMGIVTALGLYYGAMLLYNTITGISTAITAAKSFAETVHAASLAMQTGATFTATAAQYGFNAALLACPLTWIILLIIAVIAIIYAVCAAIAKLTGIANSGFGVITGGINVVIAFFKNLGLSVANIALGIGNAIAAVASNIMTAFHNAICSVQAWWYDLLSTVLNVVAGICEALNKLPFVEFDYSGITAAADDYAAKSAEAAGNKEDYKSVADAFNEGFSTFDTFQDGWASDAFASGAAWGDGVADSVSSAVDGLFSGSGTDIPNPDDYAYALDNSGVGSGIGDIAGNTGSIADSMDITEEELKYLRDIAEQETVNRFTTAEVHVDMSGMQNTVNNNGDLDGFVSGLTDAVNEAVDIITEGVHE